MHSALGGLQRQAQRRLLVEAVVIDDAAGPDTKQEVAEGCEDSDGLGTQRASCPSRDRARASLRRLRPTAWRCTQPDAHAAAINESEGSEPLSQLLQAVATTGKRLPWAHLAAREEAAAAQQTAEGAGTAAESQNGVEGEQATALPTAKTASSAADSWAQALGGAEPPAQDWSWLASPPWGVVPLPPELACRVDPHGRLRLSGTIEADVTAATAAAEAAAAGGSPPPSQHRHADPDRARMHARLQRTAGAVQQVLAVAAAAAAAAATTAAAAAVGEAAHVRALLKPDWQIVGTSRTPQGGLAGVELPAAVHTLTAGYAFQVAGSLRQPPPSERPAGPLTPAEEQLWQDLEQLKARIDVQASRRVRVGQVADFYARSPPPPGVAGEESDKDVRFAPLRCYGSERQVAQGYMTLLMQDLSAKTRAGSPDPESDTGGGGGWRRLAKLVVPWAEERRKRIWRWLLETAAGLEEAEAAGGAGKARTAAEGSSSVALQWGAAAEEVRPSGLGVISSGRARWLGLGVVASRVGCGYGGLLAWCCNCPASSASGLWKRLRFWMVPGPQDKPEPHLHSCLSQVLKAAIGTLVLLYLVVQDFLQIQQQAATKFGFCAAEQLNIFDPLVLASALPAYLLARVSSTCAFFRALR